MKANSTHWAEIFKMCPPHPTCMFSGLMWTLLIYQRYLLRVQLSSPLLDALSVLFAPAQIDIINCITMPTMEHSLNFVSISCLQRAIKMSFPNAFPDSLP